MTRLRRFAPTAPAEWPWNRWPNVRGITGRMLVEQVAEWRGIGIVPARRSIFIAFSDSYATFRPVGRRKMSRSRFLTTPGLLI